MQKIKVHIKNKKKSLKNKLDSYKRLKINNKKLYTKLKNKDLEVVVISFLFISIIAIFLTPKHEPISSKPAALGQNTSSKAEKEKLFWESYLKENPNYIDGWLELTKIEYELGNIRQAMVALEKAKNINPNLSKVKDTEMELGL